ncbi:hypothetical protein [Kitasatospora sp. DSM 101779]|uniref:hypothetical protein n=1 Tax=Kitasatospora sp. DSM 101779 TaxID=2853165 RepID=UPI0021D81A93|nr:hypothetical protein [Kitasatospora sp. DSM 101779]MCU7823863.1 hypothetical protein [Kitasatospora sp. DSM 101779]
MGSRIRTTKLTVPTQRGRRRGGPAAHVIDLGRGTQPLVVVVPRQPSLVGQLTLATGRLLWQRRIDWAPVWAAGGLFTTTAVLSAAAPAAGIALAVPAVLVPAGWAAARRWHPRSAVRRRTRALTRPVIVASAALAWSATACLTGPANWPLALLWLAGTTAAQATWWRRRKTTAATPIQP